MLLLLVGTVAFAGIGMLLAGTLRAEANLAVANGLFLVLLFLGGMAYPLAKLPDALQTFSKALPAAALSETVRAVLTPGRVVPHRRADRAPGVGGRGTPRRRPLVPLGRVKNVPRRSPRSKSSPQPFPRCSDTTGRSGQLLIQGIRAPKFTLRFFRRREYNANVLLTQSRRRALTESSAGRVVGPACPQCATTTETWVGTIGQVADVSTPTIAASTLT